MMKLEQALRDAFPESKIGEDANAPVKVSFPVMEARHLGEPVATEAVRGSGAETIRATMFARLKARKTRVTTLSLELSVPIRTLEEFAQNKADLTPPILEQLTTILWGAAVQYCADDGELYRNSEKFVPPTELSAKLKEEIRPRVAARASAPGELNQQHAKLEEEIQLRVKARDELIELSAALKEEIRVRVKARDQLSLTPEGRKAKQKAKEKERIERLLAHGKNVVF